MHETKSNGKLTLAAISPETAAGVRGLRPVNGAWLKVASVSWVAPTVVAVASERITTK